MPQPTKVKKSSPSLRKGYNLTADFIAYLILSIGLIFLPIFYIPGLSFSNILVKKIFLSSVIILTVIFWLIGRLQSGKIKIPWNGAVLLVWLLPIAFLLSAIFSDTLYDSVVGAIYQSGTVISILSLALLFVLTTILFDNTKKVLNFFLILSGLGFVAGLYYLLRFFISPILPESWGSILPISIIGNWNETGVFFGLIALISLITLEFLPLTKEKVLKYILSGALLVSILVAGLVNFYPVWVILGLVSIMVFVYKMVVDGKSDEEVKKSILRPSFIVLLVCLLFFTLGKPNGIITSQLNSLYNQFNFSYLEIRPGWTSTYEVGKEVLKEKPVFGVGPNNFDNAWSLYRPTFVNQVDYWNIDFSSAVGLLPTFIITTGIVGLLAWLLFFFGIIRTAFKSSVLDKKEGSYITKFTLGLSFVSLLYLWVINIIYVSNAFGLTLAFATSALFVSVATLGNKNAFKEFDLQQNVKLHFVSILILVVALIGSISLGYGVFQKAWAVSLYGDSNQALAVGELDRAEQLLSKAIVLDNKNVLYYRSYSDFKIRQINQVISSSELSEDEIQSVLSSYVDQSIAGARQAVDLDPLDYKNLMALGNVYEFLSNIGVEGAYDRAVETYKGAIVVHPNNPDIYIALARLEISQQNFDGARDLINQALEVKSNHPSSFLMLAQIELNNSSINKAIETLENAVAVSPVNRNLWFQLGLLRYQAGSFEEAVSALERTISLSEGGLNANASYFLGLSYAALDRYEEAIEEFEIIAEFNPDNEEVRQIIANLRAGRDPLFGISQANQTDLDLTEEEEEGEELTPEEEENVEESEEETPLEDNSEEVETLEE